MKEFVLLPCLSPRWGFTSINGQGFYRCRQCSACLENMKGEAARALVLLSDPKWSWNRFPHKQLNFVRYWWRRMAGRISR